MQIAQASVSIPLIALQKQMTEQADKISQLSSRNCINVQDNGQANNSQYENIPTNTKHIDTTSYSSIGAIPKLQTTRNTNSEGHANVSGLSRAFSHPSLKFKGSGSASENLGTYHQQFMNSCKTYNLTEQEAFNNLYVLFETGSEEGRFYHKHVLNNASTLAQAFDMLYRRFMWDERRDRLLRKWNGLRL